MKSRTWVSLVWPITAAAVAVCAVFASRLGSLHLAALVLLGIIAPITLGLFATQRQPIVVPGIAAEYDSEARFGWFGLGLFAVACVKFGVLGYIASRFIPTLHDEWSYLFGAETLARGRLTNPTPPLSEFFDAFHVLASPVWVTRYPPGHSAALAIGVILGVPAAVMVLEIAGTAWCTYRIARELAGESAGRLAGGLALVAPGSDYASNVYLSQSTFLLAITACYVFTLNGARRASIARLVAAGTFGGWAILTRPYSAVALGTPLAVWFITAIARQPQDSTGHGRKPIMLFLSAVVPVGVAVALFGLYNRCTTGSYGTTAWSEYNRQFEPDNTIGFSPGTARPIPDMDPRKAARARSIATEKLAFTWRAALRRAATDPERLSQMVFSAVGFYGLTVFLAYALTRRSDAHDSLRGGRWLIVAALGCHYVAYALFYSTWGSYALETIPFVLVLTSLGLSRFWRDARELGRPALALLVPLMIAVTVAFDAREIRRFIARRQSATQYHREFADKLATSDERAIVFVRLDPERHHPYDLIHNSPGLDGRTIIALDLGERNHELLAQFRDRNGYIYDEREGTLRPYNSIEGGGLK